MADYDLTQTGQEVQDILDGAAMQTDLTAETQRAELAEQSLQGGIDAEETRAKAAEKQNADDIDVIESKIPAGASDQNQLADKEFVNNSIATATATYRGAYNLVNDLSLTVDATHEQIATALAGAISTADNNDYCFVQIPTSDAAPTQIASIERYKFNGTAWAYEYTLNNSGFTAAQWAALNSGITSGLVAKLLALPTNDALTLALAGKQDVLTFDSVPVDGSNNPVKSGGVYSAIGDEETRAKAAEKANADDIDDIEALIPAAASDENQLADKEYVNSSISTATATYRGSFNEVNDLSLTTDATHEQIATALAGAIGTADNNDYCFVQIPTSDAAPTQIASIERYKFNGTAWAYEYTLNNSGFTAAQWAALNSGITSGLVAKLSALPTNDVLTLALAGKQDVLTFDNEPTSGSNNPVKSGGVYDAVNAEATTRAAAIAAIVALIPEAASALNQLADKSFVNSSISTATAVFKGTYNVVVDLELSYNATQEQIATMLASKIISADNNDYCFVQIPTSDAAPLQIARTDRYKFNGTTWAYEYTLNNSGFTTAQWAAINSGITSLLKDKLIDLPTATELTALLAAKQNQLTFDTTPTTGSTNPVTSGGVKTAIDTEKARAEAAEGALDSEKADKATTLAGYGITDAYTKNETYTKTEVNRLVSTPHQNYVTVPTYASLPSSGQSTDTIYRVSSYDGANNQVDDTVYSEYAWDGTQYVFLCVKSQIEEVFDITVYNSNTKYADLSAALGVDGANIPSSLRRGGMSVKFVQSSDNNYIQYRLKDQSFTTDVSQWQGSLKINNNIRPDRTAWEPSTAYVVGDKVSNDGLNYECITAHTSELDFTTYELSFWKYADNSGDDELLQGDVVSGRFADADKLIKIYDFRGLNDSWDDVPLNEVCYNTDRKKLQRKTDSGVIFIPFYKGGLYIYDNHVYMWNGNDFNPTSYALSDNLIDPSKYEVGGLSQGAKTDTESQKVTPYIDIHEYDYIRLLGGENRNLGVYFYDFYKQYLGSLSWDSNKTIELPANAYYFRKIVMSYGYAEETSLDIIGIVDTPSEKGVNLSKYRASGNLINKDDYLTSCGLDENGNLNPTITTQSVTPFIRVQGYKYITIENINRKFGIYWYDKDMKFISNSSYPNELGLAVPEDACYFRRVVQSYGYAIENDLVIKGLYDVDTAFDTNLYNKELSIDVEAFEEGGLAYGGFNQNVTTQDRTDYIDCKDCRVIYLKNINRQLGVSFYDQYKYPIGAVDYAKEIQVPKKAFYIRRVVKSQGYAEETDLRIDAICQKGYSVESVYIDENALNNNVVSVIKPEDFEGASLAEKVIAANEYILNAGGGFVLRFEDNAEYVITQAIEIPSNTTIEIVNCTIRLADNTVDNMFRSANCKPNPSNFFGFSISDPLEVVKNIRIIGTGNAKIIHCANSSISGALNTGWRGCTTCLWNVNGFEIAGFTIEKNLCWSQQIRFCRYGSIHDIVFKTERENGDGIDLASGHDIKIYNISGYTEDDTMAICASADEMRYSTRPAEVNRPMSPHYLGIYIDPIKGRDLFNVWINNIKVYNVDSSGVLDFLSNAYNGQVYDIYISDISDAISTPENKTWYLINNWTNEYGMHYEDGDLHNIYINNVVQKGPNVQSIILLKGMFHDSHFNNIERTGNVPYVTNNSGIEPEDANFVITNEH